MTARIRGPVVGSVLFAIYAATAGRGVGWEDSAFLQLALATLGVPHGPGFPIYVLAGHVWLMPFAGAAAWGANLFSAAAMAVAGALLLEITLELYASIRSYRDHTLSHGEILGAAGVILAWGTLPQVWSQAVRTEVYSLTLLLILLTVWLILRADALRDERPTQSRRLRLGAFWAWGTALAVHPLVAIAATLPWLLPSVWRWRRNTRALLLAAGCVAVPLSAYLYPLLRGRIDSAWTWGSFHGWNSILDYYFRRSAWAAVPEEQISYLENLHGWWHALTAAWPALIWIPLLVAIIWLRRRGSYVTAMLTVFALVIWAAPFDRMNLDLWGYFLPFVAFMAAGIGMFVSRVIGYVYSQLPGLSARSRQTLATFAVMILVGWPAVTILAGRQIPGRDAGAAAFVNAVSATLPEGATLIAAEDNVLGVFEFAQRVEGVRPDIKVIAPGALRYPYYRQQITQRFEADVPTRWSDPGVWHARHWEDEVRRWIADRAGTDVVYTQFDRLPGLRVECLQPAGLVYRITDSTASVDWNDAWGYWQHDAKALIHDPVAADIFGRWLFNFGALALARGHDDVGWQALVTAVERAGDNPEMYFLLGSALHRAGRLQEASAMFAAAYELAPYRNRYREARRQTEPPLAVKP